MTLLTYEHEQSIEEDDLSLSLLDISLKHGLPHAHACGGNARCSTCRVIVIGGHENVLPRNGQESELARKKGFSDNIRLACQTRITGPVRLRRLVLDESDIRLALGDKQSSGCEQKLAVLFCDLRNFTTFSERHLPYDIVHILDRYFYLMGESIIEHQGHIDKYMGDGIMALFGLQQEEPAKSCMHAVQAAVDMQEALTGLNAYLEKHFDTTFDIGIGIHFGCMIVGDMGHPGKIQFSAIGDTVNVASRIESITKTAQAPILISGAVHGHVKEKVQVGKVVKVPIKGKQGEHTLYEVLAISS